MERSKIEPGIYRHFKGKLYFVLGMAVDGVNPSNQCSSEVIYYPLYPCESIGWYRRSPVNFSEKIDRPDLHYSGPRFVKIMDWNLSNIIPGSSFVDLGYRYFIKSLYLDDNGQVEVWLKQCVLGIDREKGVRESFEWVRKRL